MYPYLNSQLTLRVGARELSPTETKLLLVGPSRSYALKFIQVWARAGASAGADVPGLDKGVTIMQLRPIQ